MLLGEIAKFTNSDSAIQAWDWEVCILTFWKKRKVSFRKVYLLASKKTGRKDLNWN
jgi:hypothetical protein